MKISNSLSVSIIVIVVGLTAYPTFAQQGIYKEKVKIEWLAGELNLSEDQCYELRKILTKPKEDAKKIIQERDTQVSEIEREVWEKIITLLNDDQKIKLTTIQRDREVSIGIWEATEEDEK